MPQLYPTFDIPLEMAEDLASQQEVRPDTKAPMLDFSTGNTKMTPTGRPVEAVGVEAYRQWLATCLLTERYEYLAYTTDFGVEIRSITRANLPRDLAESEIRRTITEALSVDPRTVSVGGFVFEWQGDSVWVSFEVDSVFGRDEVEVKYRGVA